MGWWVRRRRRERIGMWRRLAKPQARNSSNERVATARTGIITHALRRWGLGSDRCCHCVQPIKTKPPFFLSAPVRSLFAWGVLAERLRLRISFVLFCFFLRGRVESGVCFVLRGSLLLLWSSSRAAAAARRGKEIKKEYIWIDGESWMGRNN